MSIAWLEQSQAGLTEAFARRLYSRPGSVFKLCGEETCRVFAGAAIAGLRDDLAADRREAVRAAVLAFVEETAPRGLTFADVRHYGQSLRTLVLAAAEETQGSPPAQRRGIEDRLYEVLLVGVTRFIAIRDEREAERAAGQQVLRLESQLGELKEAYAEKSRLLALIRQASTPIVPIVDGIFVVPLIGVFEAARARILTEKLLQTVAGARAHAVIVDISGVPVFDGEAAQLVIRLALAVRLLGAQMLLVGVSPDIARTLVELGVDLHGLKTLASLQDGLALALAVRHLQIAPLRPT